LLGAGKAEPDHTQNTEGAVLDVVFKADGRRVYSTTIDGSVQGWDSEGQLPVQDFPRSGDAVVRRLAVAGSQLIGATDKGFVTWKTDTPGPGSNSDIGRIRCLAGSPDGKFLAVGTADAIQLRKSDSPEVVCTFRIPRVPPPAAGLPATEG